LPWGIGFAIVALWGYWATALCVIGAWAGTPVTRVMEARSKRRDDGGGSTRMGAGGMMDGVKGDGERNGEGSDDESVKRVTGFEAESHGDGKFGSMQVVKPD